MKESHLFYAPDVAQTSALPDDEAAHAVRVLRMKEGNALWVTDGRGTFYDATITMATPKRCTLSITAERSWQRPWQAAIHLCVAPTKNMERVEWLAEKATEIGIDGLHLIDCANSERRVVKTERVERILVSAMKQSHKALLPTLTPMTRFADFIKQPFEGQRFIAHCYAQGDISDRPKPFLFDVLRPDAAALVMVGPEGDFTIDEVRAAEAQGFVSVSLGESRLRTETAGLVAAYQMNLKLSIGASAKAH